MQKERVVEVLLAIIIILQLIVIGISTPQKPINLKVKEIRMCTQN